MAHMSILNLVKPGTKKQARLLITSNQQAGKKKQNGLVLLVLVIAIALSISTYYFSTISVVDIKADNIEKTQKALKKAKRALIAYTVNYPKNHAPRGPGYLLCPDANNDGVAENACNGPVTIGRLPWKTLNIGDLRDSANERLWYAVSENFDYTNSPDPPGPSTKAINTSTRGNITVRDNNKNIIYDGTTIDGSVAVIISPGVALTRDDGIKQDRSNTNTAINYLDVDTSIPEDNVDFVHGVLGGANKNGFIQGDIYDVDNNIIVNDVIEVISYNDIMEQVHRRVSQEISNLINDYFTACGAYPDASAFDPTKSDADFDSGPTPFYKGHIPSDLAVTPSQWNTGCAVGISLPDWFVGEEWHKVTYYEFSPTIPCVGGDCLVVNNSNPVVNNADAVIVFAGRDLNATRHVNDINEYFEGENNDLDRFYDADETEDYIRVIAP